MQQKSMRQNQHGLLGVSDLEGPEIMIFEAKSMRLIEAIFLQYCSGTNFGAID